MVYAGGISKCAYQLGFTKSLLNFVNRDEIKAVSAASMGIFNAYTLSCNKLSELEELYRSIDITKTTELFWQVFAKNLLAKATANVLTLGDELKIPICFPVCYIPIYSVRYYWLYGGYNPFWKKYVCAATNYPFLRIIPSVLHGRFAIDGGAVDNIPLYPLLRRKNTVLEESENFDIILVLHFDARFDYRKEFTTDVPIVDLDVTYANSFSKKHYNFSREYITEIIRSGEEYGQKISEKLFTGDCSHDGLKRKADEIFMQEHEIRQRHPSVDGWFTVINAAGKALRRDADCMKKLF